MSEKVEKGRLKKYGKEYGKYAACVVTGFALYGACLLYTSPSPRDA